MHVPLRRADILMSGEFLSGQPRSVAVRSNLIAQGITREDVQNLKGVLSKESPKTVNNVLTVLNVLMRPRRVGRDQPDQIPAASSIVQLSSQTHVLRAFRQIA